MSAAPGTAELKPVARAAGLLWVGAWTAAPVLAIVAGLRRGGALGRVGVALGGLALGYEVAYVASDLAIETVSAQPGVAPAVNAIRYLVPGWAAATGALIWVVAATPWRAVRVGLILVLVATGPHRVRHLYSAVPAAR